MFQPQAAQEQGKPVSKVQDKWLGGYVSALADSRIPDNSFGDMTNIELDQDGLPRPRPSLVRYGAAFVGTCIGMGRFTKIVLGAPVRYEISMQSNGTIGRIYIRKDGEAWTLVGGSYNKDAPVQFCQNNARVYINNHTNEMSFYDIDANSLVTYTALAAPDPPTVTPTGLSGSTYPLRYIISWTNLVGETVGSAAGTATVSKPRDNWNGTGEYVDLVLPTAPVGAVRTNIYYGDSAGFENYLDSVPASSDSYRDTGAAIINPLREAPKGDSTKGPILNFMINKNGQLFGVGDKDNPYYLWYSGVGDAAGDFSPFNGGGFVAIDFGSDNLPVNVRAYRDGRGNPALTVLCRSAAGAGKLYHVIFNTQTVGDTIITFPEVQEGNGQSGTYASRAVVEANGSLYYPTGREFKTTGTKAQVVNILATDSISTLIKPDVDKLNLAAMEKAVGLEYQNRIFWALPVADTKNNEIWILDLSRGGCWILRWTIPAQDMWLYEDNNGITHFCVLVDNTVLEFTRSVATTDDGTPFRTHLVSNSMLFGKTGVDMAYILDQHFKFLYPKGTILINVYGLNEDSLDSGDSALLDSVGLTTFSAFTPLTAWGQYLWGDPNILAPPWGGDPGFLQLRTKPVNVIPVDVDETLNELRYEITTTDADCDYLLSSVYTRGELIDGQLLGD